MDISLRVLFLTPLGYRRVETALLIGRENYGILIVWIRSSAAAGDRSKSKVDRELPVLSSGRE